MSNELKSKIVVACFTLGGYALLFWADWRIGLGLFLIQWGDNLYSSGWRL